MQHHHSLSQPPATRALFNWMSVIVLVYLILVAAGIVQLLATRKEVKRFSESVSKVRRDVNNERKKRPPSQHGRVGI